MWGGGGGGCVRVGEGKGGLYMPVRKKQLTPNSNSITKLNYKYLQAKNGLANRYIQSSPVTQDSPSMTKDHPDERHPPPPF